MNSVHEFLHFFKIFLFFMRERVCLCWWVRTHPKKNGLCIDAMHHLITFSPVFFVCAFIFFQKNFRFLIL